MLPVFKNVLKEIWLFLRTSSCDLEKMSLVHFILHSSPPSGYYRYIFSPWEMIVSFLSPFFNSFLSLIYRRPFSGEHHFREHQISKNTCSLSTLFVGIPVLFETSQPKWNPFQVVYCPILSLPQFPTPVTVSSHHSYYARILLLVFLREMNNE